MSFDISPVKDFVGNLAGQATWQEWLWQAGVAMVMIGLGNSVGTPAAVITSILLSHEIPAPRHSTPSSVHTYAMRAFNVLRCRSIAATPTLPSDTPPTKDVFPRV